LVETALFTDNIFIRLKLPKPDVKLTNFAVMTKSHTISDESKTITKCSVDQIAQPDFHGSTVSRGKTVALNIGGGKITSSYANTHIPTITHI